jgi:predicted nucleic acid-binding protein
LAQYLIDKSAFARIASNAVIRSTVADLVIAGRVATCAVIDLEILYSARSASAFHEIRRELSMIPKAPINQDVCERAMEIQYALSKKSMHRSVTLPDLLIAACAEMAGLIVLHYDKDFDVISEITKQETRWIMPRGSIS